MEQATCRFEGSGVSTPYTRLLLCGRHYQRMVNRGDYGRDKTEYPPVDELRALHVKLGDRAALAEHLGVTQVGLTNHLHRRGLRKEFARRELAARNSTPTKQCTGECGGEYPRTAEYFYAARSTFDGLGSICKTCARAAAAASRARKVRPNPGTRERYREHMTSLPRADAREMADYRAILLADPCAYCGAPATATDHIEPLARGGVHRWHNMTAACTSCNSAKRATPLLTFLMNQLPA